jgi:hypothetical protein
MNVGTLIRPARPTYCFDAPAPIVGKRMSRYGWEFAVVNGYPNNVSWRWYHLRDVRLAANPVEPAAPPQHPHSTPIDAYPDWRREELARKYAGPDEWDVERDGDGEIDDVELEESGADEELL